MKINHTIFKAYDIRGIVGKELNNDIMYSIGIVVADTRQSVTYLGLLRDWAWIHLPTLVLASA